MVAVVDELSSVIGPPSVRPIPVDWLAIESELGLVLPSDYKAVADEYPAMFINEYLRVCHPTSSDPDMNLLQDAQVRTKSLRGLVSEFPDLYVYPAYPDEGGLLCWGNNTSREQCYWLTEGEPDEWRVVIGDEEDYCWLFDGNFSEFLIASCKGLLKHSFYEDFTGPLRKIEFIR